MKLPQTPFHGHSRVRPDLPPKRKLLDMFSIELERDSFRAVNGEYGWTRVQIPFVVDALLLHDLAILGGELWQVRDGSANWDAIIPQRDGSPVVYTWETKRKAREAWLEFIHRCASDTLDAVERWPAERELPSNFDGRILYNLTWVSEAEYGDLH
jgi:hypothetical protein